MTLIISLHIQLLNHLISIAKVYLVFSNGGIAQLVERCFCTADVSGSNPLISTNRKTNIKLKIFIVKKVKRIKAYDGYLGVQKR